MNHIRTHAFISDGVADHRGRPYCAICGLVEAHRSHNIPEQDRAVAEVGARRLGEKIREAI